MPHSILRHATRHWLALLVFALFAALLFTGVPAWADARPADVSQTVPPPPLDPTATPPVATATPGDDGNIGGSVILPTPTPKPVEVAAAAAQAAQAANLTGVIVAPRVNVRSGPGLDFDIVGKMDVDQSVQVLYRNDANDWWYTCCITTTNAAGWVSAQFVRPNFDAAQSAQLLTVLAAGTTPAPAAPAAPAATPAPTAPPAADWSGTVASAVRLNLRAEPNADAEILGKLNPGETVDILYRNDANDWWYVCCVAGTDVAGWVSNQFLSSNLDVAAAQTALGVFVPGQVVLPTPTPNAPALRNPQGAAAFAAAYAAADAGVQQSAIRALVANAALTALSRAANALPATEAATEAATEVAPTQEATPTEVSAAPAATPTNEPTPEATAAATERPTAEPTAQPTAQPTARPTAQPTARPTATRLPDTTLELSVEQTPPNAAQGEAFGLTFVITNTGDAAAAGVEVRNELAPELELVTGQAQAGGEFIESTTRQGNVVFTFAWPELAPGESVVASVILSTTVDLPDGSVLTNIAAAAAENAPSVTAGVEIGMPPATAPDFR